MIKSMKRSEKFGRRAPRKKTVVWDILGVKKPKKAQASSSVGKSDRTLRSSKSSALSSKEPKAPSKGTLFKYLK